MSKNLREAKSVSGVRDSEGDGLVFRVDGDGYTIADAINANATEVVFEDDEDGGFTSDVLALANFKHLALCKPDNIRAIAAHVKALEVEKAELADLVCRAHEMIGGKFGEFEVQGDLKLSTLDGDLSIAASDIEDARPTLAKAEAG